MADNETQNNQASQQITGQEVAKAASGSANAQTSQQAAPGIDYDRLASIIQGKQSVTEDTVLKNYFKQQGLSQEEITQAITVFKEQKAKNQPDVGALQQQISTYAKQMQDAALQQAATMEAVSLGMDAKTIQYVLKLISFDGCLSDKGEADSEKIKTAINKVLEDVPALKPEHGKSKGFQIGSNGGGEQQTDQEAQLKSIFGNKN